MDFEWSDIKVFLAVANSGSLSAAAHLLNKSQPTIGRRIEKLEAQLAVTLFIRTPYGYELTEHARTLMASAKKMQLACDELEANAHTLQNQPTGTVKLACGESFAKILTYNLTSLTNLFPDISLHIETGFNFANLEKNEVDIAIRSRKPTSQNLVTRSLGQCHYAVYTTADYISKNPAAMTEERLHACRWISYCDENRSLPPNQWLSQYVKPDQIKLRCTTLTTILQAVSNGQGLAVLPCFVATMHSELKQCSPVLDDCKQDVWLVLSRNSSRAPAIKSVSQWITQLFDSSLDGIFEVKVSPLKLHTEQFSTEPY